MSARILVVDDESVTRRLVKHTLKTLDIVVEEAADGTSALEIASNQHFDMLIVDINLPDIDGFEVMEQLQQFEHLQGIPVIPFTARNNPNDEVRAAALGAAGFLYKPFSTAELRELVSTHLNIT